MNENATHLMSGILISISHIYLQEYDVKHIKIHYTQISHFNYKYAPQHTFA